jgi:hypothetical protein
MFLVLINMSSLEIRPFGQAGSCVRWKASPHQHGYPGLLISQPEAIDGRWVPHNKLTIDLELLNFYDFSTI